MTVNLDSLIQALESADEISNLFKKDRLLTQQIAILEHQLMQCNKKTINVDAGEF